MLKRQLKKIYSQDNQDGFTIIESLVAVIVLGILMTAIAPTIVISTATRVQSRRVELATLAAGAYIDGVTSGNIPAPPVSGTNADINAPGTDLDCDDIDDLKTNKGYCSSPGGDTSSYKVFCVDGSGDGKCTKNEAKDMIVQAFGFNSDSTVDSSGDEAEVQINRASRDYKLSFRVYRADAFKDNTALDKGEDGKTQSTFTGGLGKRKEPLTQVTTEIVVAGQTTFQNWCKRLEGSTGRNSNSDCSN